MVQNFLHPVLGSSKNPQSPRTKSSVNQRVAVFASIKELIRTNSWDVKNYRKQIRKKKRNPPAALLEILSVNRACAKVIRSFLIQGFVLNGVFFQSAHKLARMLLVL